MLQNEDSGTWYCVSLWIICYEIKELLFEIEQQITLFDEAPKCPGLIGPFSCGDSVLRFTGVVARSEV